MSEPQPEEQADDPRPDYPRLGEPRALRAARFRGLPRDAWRDIYHVLLTMPLAAFFAVMLGAFLAINALFALLYLADPHGVSGMPPGSFAQAFFFSVQTLGTLGYGVMAPRSLYANLVVTAEVFTGLFELAAATGLLFARISRPTARIRFTRRAVVAPFEGAPTLMLRAANQRRNLVLEAEVTLTLVRDVVTAEGATIRRFETLAPLRARSPLFFLTWQVMHRIDETSPLFGYDQASLLAARAEVLVVLRGVDETLVSTIHARASYHPHEIVFGAKLADVMGFDADGTRVIDFTRFDEIEPG